MDATVRPWLLILTLIAFLPSLLVIQALTADLTFTINASMCFVGAGTGILILNNTFDYRAKIIKPFLVVSFSFIVFMVWGYCQTFDPINNFWLWKIFG